MSKRAKMSRHYSKKLFRRGAQKVHGKNLVNTSMAMRGGIRL